MVHTVLHGALIDRDAPREAVSVGPDEGPRLGTPAPKSRAQGLCVAEWWRTLLVTCSDQFVLLQEKQLYTRNFIRLWVCGPAGKGKAPPSATPWNVTFLLKTLTSLGLVGMYSWAPHGT